MEEENQIPLEEVIIPEEHFVCEEERGGPIFVPQLYLQRYFYVQQELQKHDVKSVVDFGSAECKIAKYLVRLPSVEEIALVDIDGELLTSSKHNIQPLISDYVKCRNHSLTVKVYEGSVTQLDEVICGYEAVSMVEIIEHLYPDVLKAACEMVFGGLKPNVVIVTTPNADYNQLFPNFTGFRHWDHKFEWTQTEFREWAEDISQTYNYNVEYSGVGEPPKDSEHLGFCSQIAIFTCHSSQTLPTISSPVTNTYKLIAECNYPYRQTVKLSETEALLQEVEYLIRQISRASPSSQCETDCEAEDEKCRVLISYFLKFEKFKDKFELDQFRTFLQNHGYRITADGNSVIVPEDVQSDSSDLYDSCDNDDTLDSSTPCEQNVLCVGLDQTVLSSGSKCEKSLLCDSGVTLEQQFDCETGVDSESWE